MDPIYVTGHKNPDTDSIVAAIAYAELRNALGDRQFVPARLGHISSETKRVLELFDVQPPMLISNVRTQVKDLAYDTPPILDRKVTLRMAWEKLQSETEPVTAIPVVDADQKLYGMLTSGDIATFTMKTIEDLNLYDVPVFNLLSVLEGQIVNKVRELPDAVTGEVLVAVPVAREDMLFSNPNSIVICGQQPDMVRHAVEIGAKVVIVCQADITDEMRNMKTDTCIISTPLDVCRAARLIHLAVPVERVCSRKNIKCFHLDDYLDDVKGAVLKSRFRAYPILDDEEHVVGTLGRYHLIRPKRKKVVLVDHNEAFQSVPGLNQAEIVAIIDHHRLGDIQTGNPIFVRNEPLGSTATILANMYQENGVMPSQKMAGLLASAIISDTVMFKSPTCTETDRIIAERMAHIANISLDAIGGKIFTTSSMDKPLEETLFTDFKDFSVSEKKIGIGQITTLNSDDFICQKEEILKTMGQKKADGAYDLIMVMITDVLKSGSTLFFLGDEEIIQNAYGVEPSDNEVFLPGVMSRKKQIVPKLTEALD